MPTKLLRGLFADCLTGSDLGDRDAKRATLQRELHLHCHLHHSNHNMTLGFQRLALLKESLENLAPDVREGTAEQEEQLLGLMRQACHALRVAETMDDPAIHDIERQVVDFLEKCLSVAQGRPRMLKVMPYFGHAEGEYIENGDVDTRWGDSAAKAMLYRFLQSMGNVDDAKFNETVGHKPPPYWETRRPDSKSSKLARFRDVACNNSISDATPNAKALRDGLFETTSHGLGCIIPVNLSVSRSRTSWIVPACASSGWKDRSPSCFYRAPSMEQGGGNFYRHHSRIGLEEIPSQAAIDDERRLFFLADESRIKSYAWGNDTTPFFRSPRPVHTLRSNRHKGPLAISPQGHVIRAGSGSAAVWDLNSLPTHGDAGNAILGGEMDEQRLEDLSADYFHEVEVSQGLAPTHTIKFAGGKIKPHVWTYHPTQPNAMICGSSRRRDPCSVVDLQHGGRVGHSFLGHGSRVNDVSTNPTGDPHVFATASSDGQARMFDIRHRLPTLTMEVERDSSFESVAVAHPDGLPMLFTGCVKSQVIRLWDIRAKALLYDISTGNNEVSGLHWDPRHACLFATTECTTMGQFGGDRDYRRVRPPQPPDWGIDSGYDSPDDWDSGLRWPRDATHEEDYFPQMFDSSNHRIFRYEFKHNPDPTVLPVSGF